MNKYILVIDGMRCGMCEVHVEEVITKNIKVKKAKASHFKNTSEAFTELNLSEEDFKTVLAQTGYTMTSFKRDVAIKTFFGWK